MLKITLKKLPSVLLLSAFSATLVFAGPLVKSPLLTSLHGQALAMDGGGESGGGEGHSAGGEAGDHNAASSGSTGHEAANHDATEDDAAEADDDAPPTAPALSAPQQVRSDDNDSKLHSHKKTQ